MKRILVFILACFLLTVLCACGGNEEPAADAADVTAPAAAPAEPAAPQTEEVPPEAAASQEPAPSSGEASSAPEDVEEQDFTAFPMDGYEKTFDGYIEWVCAALESQPGNPNLERELAEVRATTEDTYDPEAMPFSMQIRFGLICSYEDFLG